MPPINLAIIQNKPPQTLLTSYINLGMFSQMNHFFACITEDYCMLQ